MAEYMFTCRTCGRRSSSISWDIARREQCDVCVYIPPDVIIPEYIYYIPPNREDMISVLSELWSEWLLTNKGVN